MRLKPTTLTTPNVMLNDLFNKLKPCSVGFKASKRWPSPVPLHVSVGQKVARVEPHLKININLCKSAMAAMGMCKNGGTG